MMTQFSFMVDKPFKEMLLLGNLIGSLSFSLWSLWW